MIAISVDQSYYYRIVHFLLFSHLCIVEEKDIVFGNIKQNKKKLKTKKHHKLLNPLSLNLTSILCRFQTLAQFLSSMKK